MISTGSISVDTNTDSVDALTAPGSVAAGRVINLGHGARQSTCLVSDVTCTVTVYVLDETTREAAAAARRWMILQAGLALTAGTLIALSKPATGVAFLRVTSAPSGASVIRAYAI